MSYEGYEHLVVEVNDGVAVVRMNRPEKLNAFNRKMGMELLQIPTELKDDPEVRVVVLTGTGRGFCTGVDTTEPRGRNEDNPFHRTAMDELGYSSRLPLAWNDLDKPTIAAVNGVAAGGGVALAMMQDLRIMAQSARMIPMFINRGVSAELGTSWFVTRLIGLTRALEWYLSGDQLSSEKALDWGLTSQVVPDGELMTATMALARKLADGPPIAQRLTKRSIYHGVTHSLREHLPYEAANVSISTVTEDATEGRNAIREKRKPNFKGR